MKVFTFLSLAATATAFVLPDQFSADSLRVDDQTQEQTSIWDKISHPGQAWEEVEEDVRHRACEWKEELGGVFEQGKEAILSWEEAFSAATSEAWNNAVNAEQENGDKPPHDGPPHDKPPHDKPPHHGPPHRKPHHPPHHGPPNQTVYQLIASSKYTTKLAKLISEYPDLVKTLNGTSANFTVFAPTDRAFDKIPEDAPKPSKEFLKKVLLYHVSPHFYPAGRVLVTRTIPMALEARFIKGHPQRVSTQIGPRGLTVNFYARIVAVNIFGTNGVIHGLDSILLPPPRFQTAIAAVPGEFSTFELALRKTGIWDKLNQTDLEDGSTIFAPTNEAWRRLGPRLNAFLFSSHGEKYLKALLEYHGGANITLYSDAIYKASDKDEGVSGGPRHRIPKGLFHIDFPTALGKKLNIDIARYGRFISMKINGFVRAGPLDACLADGVAHALPFVLIPPRELAASGDAIKNEMSVEEFKERMAQYVEADRATGDEHNMEL